jgi:Xaa-Pro aminopeptidase
MTATGTAAYAERRVRLAAQIARGVAIIPTAPERIRNRDSHYPYRPDSYFYYLTGFREPEAVVVIVGDEQPLSLLFCREKDLEREIWDGFRFGPDAAREAFGFDAAHPIRELDTLMPQLLADRPAVYCHLGADPAWDARVLSWINTVRGQARRGVAAPAEIRDVHALLDELRLIKDLSEVQVMRRAAAVSSAAHVRAMSYAAPGRYEYEIEAELMHEFLRGGAQAAAYTPIVASGANACILHYIANDAQLSDGELLLIDAGCELHCYASDITRTFPVNGRFSAAQQAVYEIVLAAQAAAIEAVKPGNPWNMPHDAAVRVLTQGLVDMKLLTGSVDALIETEGYRKFYMHRTGHWLGLDVHDAGAYKQSGQWRTLEPGMVMTVEPGCYIRPAADVPDAFANIGVRIEDDVLVTESGCEVITSAPKAVDDVVRTMRGS